MQQPQFWVDTVHSIKRATYILIGWAYSQGILSVANGTWHGTDLLLCEKVTVDARHLS